jgi:hypothetical protein
MLLVVSRKKYSKMLLENIRTLRFKIGTEIAPYIKIRFIGCFILILPLLIFQKRKILILNALF